MKLLCVSLLAALVTTSEPALAGGDGRAGPEQEAVTAQPHSDPPEQTAGERDDAPSGPTEPKEDSISLLGSRFSLVAGGAMLWPTSREVRETYGSSHPSTSIGFWSFRAPRGFGFSLDLGWRAFGRDETGEIDIWSANAGAVWLSRHRTRDLIPYLGLRAGPQLVGIPERDLRLAFGATLEAGVVLWRRLIVSGRYDQLTRTAGLNLSNLSARIAVRVF